MVMEVVGEGILRCRLQRRSGRGRREEYPVRGVLGCAVM